jgi:hypothetical protein
MLENSSKYVRIESRKLLNILNTKVCWQLRNISFHYTLSIPYKFYLNFIIFDRSDLSTLKGEAELHLLWILEVYS